MPRRLQPGRIETFNGLWKRGSVEDTPLDHFSEAINLTYREGVEQREGLAFYNIYDRMVRVRVYKPNPPDPPRLIGLSTAGNLVDMSTNAVLIGNTEFLDFALVNFFGRAYITFSDGKVGIEGQSVYAYDGTDFRIAAGLAAVGVPTLAYTFDGTSKLEQAEYLFAVSFETESGFITRPSTPQYVFCGLRNTTPGSVGGNRVNLTAIPTGPAGTVARWILGTRAILPILSYNGDPESQSYYFVARIADNTTTTYTASYFDTEVTESADYLFDLLQTIPCGVGLADYKGRLISYGEFDDPSLVRVSTIGEPESFSETSGFIITDPTDSSGVRSATEFRSILYIFKSQRAAFTQDNGGEASTWELEKFEKSIGTEQHGIAEILDAKGSSADGFLVASFSGIHYFNGVFQEPELTYKINDLWDRVNKAYFYKIQLLYDPHNKKVYCLVPLDNSPVINYIIFGDCLDGLNPSSIKWSLWEFIDVPQCGIIYTDENGLTVTRFGQTDQMSTLDINRIDDVGDAIRQMLVSAPSRWGDGISQVNEVILRLTGQATVSSALLAMDDVQIENLETIDLYQGGREFNLLASLESEHLRLRISCNGVEQYFNLRRAILVGQEVWKVSPR